MNFEEKAREWLEEIAGRGQEHYEPFWNVEKCGHSFVMMQKMSTTSRSTFLGVDTKWGKMTTGGEYCYFYLCEKLTLELLRECSEWISQMEQEDVDKSNDQHCFTFISLVLITDGPVTKEMQKFIKRYKHITYYNEKKEEYGWSSGCLAVMDLSNGEMYSNVMGDSLQKRLQGENGKKKGLFRFFQ